MKLRLRLCGLGVTAMQININEAETCLAKLGELAWQGEEIVIAKDGKPYLTLTPYREEPAVKQERQFGRLKGQIWIAPDFDETPQEIIDLFENSRIFPDEE